MVKGKLLDDARGDEVKSRFVAQEVAYEVRDDVHAGTPGLKVLRILVSMAAMQGQRLAIYDTVAAFLHAWMDGVSAGPLGRRGGLRASQGLERHSACVEPVASLVLQAV